MNHWKLGLLALASAFVLTACPTPTPTPPPPPPPLSPPTPPSPPPPPAVITVAGKVIGQNLQPVANAPVVISGRPSTTTDTNGNFSVNGVTAPYNATVVANTQKVALVYQGLTRTDPTLIFLDFSPGISNSATLNGTISGGAGFPEPANHITRVAFGSPETSSSTTANTNTGAYTRNLSWFGPTTTTGSIYALQWLLDGSGFPSDYKGFGTKANVALSNGGTFNNQDVAMSNVTEASVVGNVTVPAGFTNLQRNLTAIFGGNGQISLLNDTSGLTNFTYITPNLGNMTLTLMARASNGNALTFSFKTGLAPNATGVNIALPAAPTQSLPVDAATGITTNTDFSWTNFAGGVHLLQLTSGGNPQYLILTAGTTTKIPDLSSLGLGLPAGTNYTWRAFGFAPYASVDAAAGPAGFLDGVDSNTAKSDVSFARSANRTFTTAP